MCGMSKCISNIGFITVHELNEDHLAPCVVMGCVKVSYTNYDEYIRKQHTIAFILIYYQYYIYITTCMHVKTHSSPTASRLISLS